MSKRLFVPKVEYDENFKAKRIDSVVISTQHSPDISQEEIREFVISNIIKTTLPKELNELLITSEKTLKLV